MKLSFTTTNATGEATAYLTALAYFTAITIFAVMYV